MRWLGLLLVGVLPFVACTQDAPAPSIPLRSCEVTVWHRAASNAAQVEVVTSWDGWKQPGRILPADRGDGWRVTRYDPPPGDQEYGIVEDGQWMADPNVGTTAFHDGIEVSLVHVDDCSAPALRVDAAAGHADGTAEASLTFLAAASASPLDPASVRVTELGGSSATVDVATDPAKGTVSVTAHGLAPGKHTLFVAARDASGKDAEPGRVTVWEEASPFDWRDASIYQVMVDRYRGPGGEALPPPADPAGWAGGTLSGVLADVQSGKFAAMGFNTLWLSPLYQNPQGEFPGTDGHMYSAYHGYWPTASRALDPRFGTEADLDALVSAAHARGIRILFDVVPHHVHQEHPYVAAHADGAWFTDWGKDCVCGTATCDWGTHLTDCWFAPYLPSFDWTRDDVAQTVTADVAWWIDRFDGDGIRIDAVPMMPRAATRRIVAELRRRFDHPGNRTYVLGENFTGPGGYDELRYQLGPSGLDGEFHFPLMWTLRGAIADETEPLSDIDLAVQTGEQTWKGAGAIMALMIGNHDVTRFASESDGSADGSGFTPAPQPTDPGVYARQRMALGMVFTLPGVPVVYYGDEVGLAGRHDPDSRRVLPADDTLTADQKATRDFVAALGKVRACSVSLRRGTYRPLVVGGETLAFAREADGAAPAIVVAMRAGLAPMIEALPGVPAGEYVDALSGEEASLNPELTNLDARPFSVRVFLPKGDPCASP